jgi:hypothetical protein
VFRDFFLQQTGTPRTGSGIYGSYLANSIIDGVGFGCRRLERQLGDPDRGFAYGIRLEGPAGDSVTDFNTITNCYFLGNTLAVYLQNQCDRTVITRCGFEPRQDVAYAQDGVQVNNSSGITIQGNNFNFFKFDSLSFGLKLSGDVSGVNIGGNYFEQCRNGIYLSSTSDQDGISITGNFFAQNIAGTASALFFGVRAGVDSEVWKIRSLVIQGNEFQNIHNYGRGVRIGGDVVSYLLGPNHYELIGSTDCFNNTIVVGAGAGYSGGAIIDPAIGGGSAGVLIDRIPESSSATDEETRLIVRQKAEFGTGLWLLNTNAAAQRSPRIRLSPGAGGASLVLDASSAGALQMGDNAGAIVASITQAGALATSSNVTSGGHLRGLKSTAALTGSTEIPTVNTFLIDITNTSGSNTFTLAAPSSVDGKILILRVAAITAGDLSLADSGNVSLSAAWTTPGVGDTLTLVASGVVWYELCRSNN